ncbi:GumC family protein [Paucibacter sp. B51]|uniref:GumC family protein n=1 Tax=Paucibacter sp. B51 TaxID=2993315 RepID=UPI0022EBC346|nr:Wzz/FepE/Etk N-terminal domain-containing protein [Paucibacter sp. B51]
MIAPSTFPAPVCKATSIQEARTLNLIDVLSIWISRKGQIALATVAAGAIGLGISYLVPPTFTASTTFIPPLQQQNSASSLVASLGALSGLAGGVGSKSPADQYVTLMQSNNITDKLVDKFDLMRVYDSRFRFGARQALAKNSRISLGKKDGLITVEVDATDPKLAADIANNYVLELRRLSTQLVLSEAQERRAFFEAQLKQSRAALQAAEKRLQHSGFDSGALKTEPRSAAEAYARIRAEITSAEVRLQAMRRNLTDGSPEVQQLLALIAAMRSQAEKLESKSDGAKTDAGYVAAYRDYKYQETLFEMFSKQLELARLDETRDGPLIQVVDAATVPEYKSKPKRAAMAVSTSLAALVAMLIWTVALSWWRTHFVKVPGQST